MAKHNFLVFDIETKRRVLKEGETPYPQEETVTSWNDRTNMGISIICAKDPETLEEFTFFEEDFYKFPQLLQKTEVLVGYNSILFDRRMLHHFDLDVLFCGNYDMMQEIARVSPKKKFLKLDSLLTLNGLSKKLGDGKDAPYLYQTNRLEELKAYCLQDVRSETELFQLCLKTQPIRISETESVFPYSPHNF
jgi:hypothetical protein